ncbi:NADPH-dependent FMN reductase [Micromonospora auratinigra]|uniref:NAD(P)H-dependent FMN reductase n=1 Tax=Micromonospora auratinigra TaxID=261654 RepID=A0A1A8Z455_9ACTN|nr:NADPH-dependent FMN reductase [Micromonospora auratinigra]SBT38714.1 NAD(P)H-dependent FMN reductase [Micromonospora auratinigra]
MLSHLLLISGSTRTGSTNTAVLRTVQTLLPVGVTATLYRGLSTLPAFSPDVGEHAAAAAAEQLRSEIDRAAAVLFCTPEYAGALPGSLKNLIDWTVGGGELYRKPVAWINVAQSGRGSGAHAELTKVLGYVDAHVLRPGGFLVPVDRTAVGPDGLVTDEDVLRQLREVLEAILTLVGSLV